MGAAAYEDWIERGSGKAPEILAKAAAARPGAHNGSGFLLPVSECLMAAVLPEIDYLPQMPADSSRRIAIAGAGAIVTGAHLPAYALAGFKVAGIWNRTRARAEAAAQRFGIERVYENVDQLVADDSVEIVDIALIPDVQLEIVQAAAAAGKHILCQKPLHEQLAPARAMVECCQAAGVKLNVNQQLRHDARMRSVAALFDKDLLGRPTRTMFDTNIDLDYDFPWLAGQQELEIMYHSIHYLDTLRAIFGNPHRVYCTTGCLPDQQGRGETRSTTVLDFPGGHTALVFASSNNRHDTQYARFRFEGSGGTVIGDNHLFSGSAAGDPTRLMVRSDTIDPEVEFVMRVPELRVPHSFVGPMASLMKAIEDDSEPDPGGLDNLDTIALVRACYRSAEIGQAVEFESAATP